LDQLAAVGLSGALLLPVARIPGKAEEMLDASQQMFCSGTNLYHACAFPIGLQTDQLFDFFRAALENYKISAIKIHPSLAGIDPLTQNGHDQIEATLEAAGALGLPVIIHGGRTSALSPCEAAEYGIISHLETINWQLSTAPVILAHAGCYELTEDEAETALSKLATLFEKYPNLMADTSNLRPAPLRLVLNKVCRSRLLFGSDALYIPTWEAWLRFLQALQEVSSSPDDDLVRIAALNPANCLGIRATYPLLQS
jgi:predicted TIM-barrel fold metal-dependent hydrolase